MDNPILEVVVEKYSKATKRKEPPPHPSLTSDILGKDLFSIYDPFIDPGGLKFYFLLRPGTFRQTIRKMLRSKFLPMCECMC